MVSTERTPVPAYRRVSEQLRREIAAGQYRNGLRLPTEADLAALHGVSRQTVRRAYQDLVTDGIVYRIPGRGSFTNDDSQGYRRQLGSIEELLDLSADTTMEIVEPLRRGVHIEAASRLRLDNDLMHSVVLRRVHDGVPFALTTVYLPEHVAVHVQGAAELTTRGESSSNTVMGLLQPHLTHPITEAAQSITVARANIELARELNCAAGHPLLRADRLYLNDMGTPTELSISYFLPEHYTYRSTLRRHQ